MIFAEYPKWIRHAVTGKSMLVVSAEEEAAYTQDSEVQAEEPVEEAEAPEPKKRRGR